LPHYYIDLHTKMTFWSQTIDYVRQIRHTPHYGRTRIFTKFTKPDLAVGRIMADDVHDSTKMLVKTFFRKQFLPADNTPVSRRKAGEEGDRVRRTPSEPAR